MRIRPCLILVCTALLLAACKARKPKGVLSEEKMEQILYQYNILRSMATMGDSSNIKGRAYVLACLEDNGVTEAEFDSSLVWYFQHMEYLQKIYQNIHDRYGNEMAALGAAANDVMRYSALSATGDTANVWNGRSYYLLGSNGFNNRMAFELDVDTSYKAGDSFVLSFRADFLQKDGQRHGLAALAVEYDNDSVGHTQRHFYGSGDNTLTIPAAPRAARRVYGFIYMISDWSPNQRLLFIFHPALVRMHTIVEKPEPQEVAPADSLKNDSLHNDSLKTTTDTTGTTTAARSLTPESMHARPMPKKAANEAAGANKR